MATMLFILILLAVFHFIYEGILAPTLRIYQRNKFFTLRDQLRNIDYVNAKKNDQIAIDHLHKGICNSIYNLHKVNIHSFTAYQQEYKSNKQLQNKVDYRIKQIEQASIPEIQQIFSEAGKVTATTMLINSGAWFIYLVPIVLVLVFFTKCISLSKDMLLTPNLKLTENNSISIG